MPRVSPHWYHGGMTALSVALLRAPPNTSRSPASSVADAAACNTFQATVQHPEKDTRHGTAAGNLQVLKNCRCFR